MNKPSEYGQILLIYHVRWSEAKYVKLVLDAGADPNVRNENNRTALSYTEDPEKVEYLLKAGADPNDRDKMGMLF